MLNWSPWPAPGQTHTELMDFFIKQTAWPWSMENTRRRQYRQVSRMRISCQLSLWWADCCRWGLAFPLSPINTWDIAPSKETLCCPKTQPNRRCIRVSCSLLIHCCPKTAAKGTSWRLRREPCIWAIQCCEKINICKRGDLLKKQT